MASTWSLHGAGSSPVRSNAARCAGVAWSRNWGICSFASFRLAAPKTVTRMDRPSEPPTCCVALSTPEAAPVSCGATLETAMRVSDTNCMPMPMLNTSIGPRMLPAYVLSTSVIVSQPRPPAASSAPITMNGLGP